MAMQSTMLPLGTAAPELDIDDVVTGERVTLASFADSAALVVIFFCNHCPYVKHLQDGLVGFGADYADSDVAVVAISSNDAEAYPDDSPEQLAAVAQRLGYPFPVLFDQSQDVAKAYTAACTPDFFVFGPDRTLVYRGRFDPSRPGSDTPVSGADLRAAVDAVVAGRPPPADQHPSVGCSIKWIPGNEPV